jgi:hypothetical protein
VSSVGFPCYALAGFLHRIIGPLAGKSESFVKNSGHFVQLLKAVNLQSQDTLVSFDFVSLFTNVPIDETLQIIENKLRNDDTLAEQSILQVEALVELVEICLRTAYFHVDNKIFQQKDGMAVGNCPFPIISNIFMEHFEKLALDSAPYKPSLWLRYVDDRFVVWPHGPEQLHNFLGHLSSLRPSISFTMETELMFRTMDKVRKPFNSMCIHINNTNNSRPGGLISWGYLPVGIPKYTVHR